MNDLDLSPEGRKRLRRYNIGLPSHEILNVLLDALEAAEKPDRALLKRVAEAAVNECLSPTGRIVLKIDIDAIIDRVLEEK